MRYPRETVNAVPMYVCVYGWQTGAGLETRVELRGFNYFVSVLLTGGAVPVCYIVRFQTEPNDQWMDRIDLLFSQ